MLGTGLGWGMLWMLLHYIFLYAYLNMNSVPGALDRYLREKTSRRCDGATSAPTVFALTQAAQ